MIVRIFIHQVHYEMKNWVGDSLSVLIFYIIVAQHYDGHN